MPRLIVRGLAGRFVGPERRRRDMPARVGMLSKRMGHSSIKVTYDRYHHLYRESEAEEREALNAYLRTHGG